jgi:transposase
VDESGFACDMPRLHGYSLRGQRCFGTKDWRAGGRINVLGALFAGVLLTTSLTSENVDSGLFNLWLERDLIPKLPENSVVVMDNASFHKCANTAQMIKAAGHVLEYLPPYSPDLNPIEQKWAQAKAKIRKTKKMWRLSLRNRFESF